MPLHIDDRHERALHLKAHYEGMASGHRERLAQAERAGDQDTAERARNSAERAERLAKGHARTADRLAPRVPLARTARRLNEQSATGILAKAVEAAATTPHPIHLSPKEAAKRARENEKRQRLLRQGEAARQKERARAGLEQDERTAAAQREIVVGNVRGDSEKRGSLADVGTLIARRTDRTGPRLEAIRRFDELCHCAYAGLFPEPRFERGVDTSKRLPGVPDSRADGLREMQNLTNRIGDEAQALLFLRVFERRTLAWMAGQGMGEPERLGVLFLAAVDAVARFYGIAERSRVIEVMEERLQAV